MENNKPEEPKTVETAVVQPTGLDKRTGVHPQSTAIPPTGSEGSITWTASEFIAHNKGPLWYITLTAVSVVVAFLVWLITKDKITASVFVVAGVVLAIFGAKKPRNQEYRIDRHGIRVGAKQYDFNSFRSFLIVKQGAFSSLVFLPLKRFSLTVSAYYDPEDEQKIISIISNYLPLEERKQDILDNLMWRIRF